MVYLVDDDEDDLEIVQAALLNNSYKGPVDTASNGQVLLERLNEQDRTQTPKVIVLDLNMPLKNGFETLAEIRTNPLLKGIPVIILTASSKKEDEIRCFELGCNYFCSKPSKMEDYVPIVMVIKRFLTAQIA
ncbi:MAG TPA: response regulator [Chryseolinea sp.]|nr:response regulator [Chryseolinea sp.]